MDFLNRNFPNFIFVAGVGQALISSKDFVSGSGTNNLNSSKGYLIEVITFKENFDPNKDDVSIRTIKAYSGSGKAGPKNKIIKDGSVRINRKLNQTIKDRGDQFKLTRNTRVSSSDSLKSVVELINSQLSTEEGRDSSIYDEKHLEE
ncbi:hypothetical protein Gohar_009037, partial [Gossypium harknessii]|nr:hypothetical protein [Gossypium harknessii]